MSRGKHKGRRQTQPSRLTAPETFNDPPSEMFINTTGSTNSTTALPEEEVASSPLEEDPPYPDPKVALPWPTGTVPEPIPPPQQLPDRLTFQGMLHNAAQQFSGLDAMARLALQVGWEGRGENEKETKSIESALESVSAYAQEGNKKLLSCLMRLAGVQPK